MYPIALLIACLVVSTICWAVTRLTLASDPYSDRGVSPRGKKVTIAISSFVLVIACVGYFVASNAFVQQLSAGG